MKTVILFLLFASFFVINCTQFHSIVALDGDSSHQNFTTSQSTACCNRCGLCSIKETSCCGYSYSTSMCYYCQGDRDCCYNESPEKGFCCETGHSCCLECETGLNVCSEKCSCDFETSVCCGGKCCLKSKCCGDICCDSFNTKCVDDKCVRKAMVTWEWILIIISYLVTIIFPIVTIALQMKWSKDEEDQQIADPNQLTEQFLYGTPKRSKPILKRLFFKILELPFSWISVNIIYKLVGCMNAGFAMFISLIGVTCCDNKDRFDILQCSSIPVPILFMIISSIISVIWFVVGGIYVSWIKGAQMTFIGSTSYNVGNMRVTTTSVTQSSDKVFNLIIVLMHSFLYIAGIGAFLYFTFNYPVKVCLGI